MGDCWEYGSYEAHGGVRGVEKGCVEEMHQNEQIGASLDRVGQGSPIGPAMKTRAGSFVARPMASGHLARSGGTTTYAADIIYPFGPDARFLLALSARSGGSHPT